MGRRSHQLLRALSSSGEQLGSGAGLALQGLGGELLLDERGLAQLMQLPPSRYPQFPAAAQAGLSTAVLQLHFAGAEAADGSRETPASCSS